MRAKLVRMWQKKQYRWKYMMDRDAILRAKYSVRRSSSNLKWYWDDYFTDLHTSPDGSTVEDVNEKLYSFS